MSETIHLDMVYAKKAAELLNMCVDEIYYRFYNKFIKQFECDKSKIMGNDEVEKQLYILALIMDDSDFCTKDIYNGYEKLSKNCSLKCLDCIFKYLNEVVFEVY